MDDFCDCMALSAASAANPARRYRLVNLDAALGVNNRGQVVGYNRFDDGFDGFSRAVLYSAPRAELTDLGTLGGTSSAAFSINSHGQVTGWSNVAGGSPNRQPQHAFRFDGQ